MFVDKILWEKLTFLRLDEAARETLELHLVAADR
jgi:hypothetical protein